MCNYKLTVTLEKSVDVVDGGGWVTGMTWRKAVILEAGERASVLALRDLLNQSKPAMDDLGYMLWDLRKGERWTPNESWNECADCWR